jgi:hypothetical protein
LIYEQAGLFLFFEQEVIFNESLAKTWEKVSLFSEKSDCAKLTCIDIEAKDVKLFGEKIIGRSSAEIVALMVKNNITNQTMESEDWGEMRISFEDYMIDFLFENDALVSINIGK